ncbi:MAG: ABC transporter permease [Candidatus Cloacimonadaceae bacterium]|jgi:ABC-2 type transport system permease protein|nr:ABC transporter permease [Candidatus Cloacimonadota bacterium]MCK9242986.1 ABC transporter permease [Candidatus Cloacimonadota bacterium]MDY0126916.1 ABC transporter permease [Candidatus Cloacimonadaceae bacterium]
MRSLKVIGSFIKKEFKQIIRSREMLIVLFALPAIQLLVMGFAVTNEVKNLNLSFLDYDRSAHSLALIQNFGTGDRFRIVPVDTAANPQELISAWKASVVIVIPPGFGEDYQQGRQSHLQVIVDGIDGNTASVANGLVAGVVGEFHQKNMQTVMPRSPMPRLNTQVELLSSMSFNPDLKGSLNTVPGIIAILVTVTSMMLSAISLVKEKELGTLEQLLVTPVKKWELMAGKLIPYLIITLVQLQVAIMLARIIFRLDIAGSYLVLLLFSVIYLFTTLGLGILISTKVESQQQAMFFSWFTMVIIILLSGFFVPVQNMPRAIRWISFLNPLSHYMTVLREIVIKGSGITQLLNELRILGGSGLVIFGISVISFRKRV